MLRFELNYLGNFWDIRTNWHLSHSETFTGLSRSGFTFISTFARKLLKNIACSSTSFSIGQNEIFYKLRIHCYLWNLGVQNLWNVFLCIISVENRRIKNFPLLIYHGIANKNLISWRNRFINSFPGGSFFKVLNSKLFSYIINFISIDRERCTLHFDIKFIKGYWV